MRYLRALAALLLGLVLGSLINMALILIGCQVIPPPAGVDPSDSESLIAGMHLFEPRHFLFPWLAHAFGTLVGAALAGWIAREFRVAIAMTIGCLFLAGGIAASILLPAPAWFIALDLILAYLPMAWLGAKLSAPRPRTPDY